MDFFFFPFMEDFKKVPIIIFSTLEKIKYVLSTVIHNNHLISNSSVPL